MNEHEQALFDESEKLIKALGELKIALKELNHAQLELTENIGAVINALIK